MNRVFADTHFYVALMNERDAWHERALAAAESVLYTVTTEYILLEVGNSLNRSHARNRFPELVRSIYADEQTTVVPGSEELLLHGVEMFAQHRDKQWSLTDCTSIAVMRQLELGEVLTADKHFEQAGFRALLR